MKNNIINCLKEFHKINPLAEGCNKNILVQKKNSMLWIIRALFIIIGIVSGTIVSGTSGGIIAFFAVAILIGIGHI